MVDNIRTDETNPAIREIVHANSRKIIRFVTSFDMVVFAIYFSIQMWIVHQYLTMGSSYKNGTAIKIPPLDMTTTNTGYFYLAVNLIELMLRIFPMVLFFIATNKLNNENNPKRCVCLIKTSLTFYTILDVFYIINILGLISDEEDDRTKGVKWITLIVGVYKIMFLFILYNQACRLLNFPPVVTVHPSTIRTNYMEPGGQSQVIIVVPQASASTPTETKPEADATPKPG